MVRSMVIVGTETSPASRLRLDPPHPRPEVAPDFADSIRAELRPEGVAETTAFEGIVRALWTIHLGGSNTATAERSLGRNLRALVDLRSLRKAPDPGPIAFEPVADGDMWRSRLILDASVSETSPVVRGTWITVAEIISRIVDGWTWADLLRANPELCEDDLRACMAFATEDEAGR